MGRSATDCTAGIWHRPFLAAFSNSGNIGASARNARIHRQTVYKALERDQTFREKFEKAKEEAILMRVALGTPGVIRTRDPLLRRYFALSAVLP